MEHKCNFCEKIFTTKIILKTHQAKAKFCLKIQNKKPEELYQCIYCTKNFNVKYNYDLHIASHSSDPIFIQLLKSQEESKELKMKLDHKDETLKNALEQVNSLQDKISDISMKAVSAPKVKNTYNTVNIENFTAMTDEHIQNSAKYLTIEHINDGPHGYAVFIVTITCKNSIVVTDGSRMIFKYKDKNNKLFVDVEARNLLTKISKAIDPINNELLLKATKALNENKNMDLMYKISRKALLLEYCNGIKFMDGEPSDFSRTLIHEMMVLTQKRVNGMIEDKPEEKKEEKCVEEKCVEEKCVENAIEIDLLSDVESEILYYSDS